MDDGSVKIQSGININIKRTDGKFNNDLYSITRWRNFNKFVKSGRSKYPRLYVK